MTVIQRNDHAVRIEVMPLFDVVFLLLTFFIFTMLLMVRADMLQVNLAPLGTAQPLVDQQASTHTVQIDRFGKLFLDSRPVTADQIIGELGPTASGNKVPMLFVALSQEAQVDRAPVLLDLIRRFVEAGIRRYTFVGAPAQQHSQ